jgi:hypothetical protein
MPRARSNAAGWWLAVVALITLAGCAATEERGRGAQFDNIALAYETAIRWSDFERAAGVAGVKGAEKEALQQLKQVKVISYDRVSAEVSPDGTQIRQIVQIEYTLETSMKLRRIVDQQGWQFDTTQKRWVLVTGLPDFLGKQ